MLLEFGLTARQPRLVFRLGSQVEKRPEIATRLAGMMLSQLVIGRFLKERAPLVDSPVPDLFDKSQDAKVATAVLNPMLSCLRRP